MTDMTCLETREVLTAGALSGIISLSIWFAIHLHIFPQHIALLIQWIFSLFTGCLDLVIGQEKRKDTIISLREFAFNQSIQMFLFPFRFVRYICPRSCFPRVCRWMYAIHDGIRPKLVAGFIYFFINCEGFYGLYIFGAWAFLSYMLISDVVIFMKLFTGASIFKALVLSMLCQGGQMESPVQMGMLGASRIITSIALYVRNLMVQLQRMLFLYTMNDQLDEVTGRRKAFIKGVDVSVPQDLIDLIFKFDSVGVKAITGMIEAVDTYEFPYYTDNCAAEKELLQERMSKTGGMELLD